jgi:insertion element IS1 protein InsB
VQQKATRPWIWSARDATTPQIIAFHVGERRREGTQALGATSSGGYREQATFQADPDAPSTGVIPADRHTAITTKARTPNHLERFNHTLSLSGSHLVRETLSSSQKLVTQLGAIT